MGSSELKQAHRIYCESIFRAQTFSQGPRSGILLLEYF
jgi:hypothetical protein